MIKNFPGEKWKPVKFKFKYDNDLKFEVSNFGRVKSISKHSDGNILKGSITNGYPVIRSKFFKARDEKKQLEFDKIKKQGFKLAAKVKKLTLEKAGKSVIAAATKELNEFKKAVSLKYKADEKTRTIYYHVLIHRLVADYFLPKPTKNQVVVAHLDFNKLNNRASNLKWMTLEENYAHQKKSPIVIAEKKSRIGRFNGGSPTAKLTETKVMLLKKLLNQNKTVRQLAKKFKVTDTQIIRIKKGENWGYVKAAK